MRVTSTSSYTRMTQALGGAQSRVDQLQQQLGTGRRINRASDDPVGSSAALRHRSLESDQTSWQRAADDAATRLAATDTALQSSSSALRRVQELVVLAGNGALTSTARAAIRDELLSLRDELVDLANTGHAGHALFGGFAQSAVRKLDGTWDYVGDGGQVRRQVGAGVTVAVNVSAAQVFGFDRGPGQDLFSVLERVAAAAGSADAAALAADAAALEQGVVGVRQALGSVGATTNRVESARERSLAYGDQLRVERSAVEDLDLAEAVMELSMARTGYEAALGAVAKASLPSLAAFLR